MGNHISVDTCPRSLGDLFALDPQSASTDTVDYDDCSQFSSNIKAWAFKARKDDPLESDTLPVDFTNNSFSSFDSTQCYIVLHLFRQKNRSSSHVSNVQTVVEPSPLHMSSKDKNVGKLQSSLLKLAISTSEQLTPRGTEHKFSTHDLQTIFFNSRIYNPNNGGATKSDSQQEVHYDLYLWHGKSSSVSTQAFAITKGYEMERRLLNNKIPQNMFYAGKPETITRYFVDDVPPVRSKSAQLHNTSSSSVALFMSLYQHCHLFRSLAKNDCSGETGEDGEDEPDIAFRSLLQLPPGDNNQSFLSIDGMSALSDDDDDTDMKASPMNSPQSSPERPTTSRTNPLQENAGELRFDRSVSYSQVLPKTFKIQMAKIPTAMPSLNLPSPRKRPPPEGIKTSDSKRQLKTLSSVDSQGTPSSLSTPRSIPTSLPSSGRSMSTDRDRLRVNLGSVDLGERHDPSPTPRRMQQQTLPERCLSGNELVVYYRKVCSQIYDYVYLGSDLVARNKEILQKNGITHIVNAAKVVCDVYFPDDFNYHVLNLYDAGNESILGTFFGVIDFIEKARINGGKVYIHCYEGVSRSTTLTISYLMWKLKQKFNTVMEDVKLRRPVASPNPGFIVQLIQWEKMILESHTQLFRISPQNDRYLEHKHCVPKLCYTNVLDSRTCFVLHSSPLNIIYLWVGSKSKNIIVEAQKFVQQLKLYMGNDETSIKIIQEGQETSEFESARSTVKIDTKIMLSADAAQPYPDLDYLDLEPDVTQPDATPINQHNEEELDDSDEELENADLYVYPGMEMIDNFDSEDLNDDEAYVLHPRLDQNLLYIWVGEGFASEVNKSFQEAGQQVADDFLRHKQMASTTTKVVIVEQDEEPEEFWRYFVNG